MSWHRYKYKFLSFLNDTTTVMLSLFSYAPKPHVWKRRQMFCVRKPTKVKLWECLWHYRYLPRYLFIFVSNKWSSLLCFSTTQYWINSTSTNLNDFVRFGMYFWRLWIFFERHCSAAYFYFYKKSNWCIRWGQKYHLSS